MALGMPTISAIAPRIDDVVEKGSVVVSLIASIEGQPVTIVRIVGVATKLGTLVWVFVITDSGRVELTAGMLIQSETSRAKISLRCNNL
jgi:hypothetical protein